MTARESFSLARKRWHRERVDGEAQRQALMMRVERIVHELLAAESTVKAAYLVGSLVIPGAYDLASDIDIAVLGLAPERYLSTLGTLQERIGTERVDLIELERTFFRQALERYGRRVL